jgi:hypothetical protein
VFDVQIELTISIYNKFLPASLLPFAQSTALAEIVESAVDDGDLQPSKCAIALSRHLHIEAVEQRERLRKFSSAFPRIDVPTEKIPSHDRCVVHFLEYTVASEQLMKVFCGRERWIGRGVAAFSISVSSQD